MIKETEFSVEMYLSEEAQRSARLEFLEMKERIDEQLTEEDLKYNCIWSARGNLQNKILFYFFVLNNIPVGSAIELTSLELKVPLERHGYIVSINASGKPVARVFLGAIYRSIFGIWIRRIHNANLVLRYDSVTTLVDSFVTKSSFSTGSYVDRNYGTFDKGKNYLYLVTNLIANSELYMCAKYIRESQDILLDDYFLTPSNHLKLLYGYIKRYFYPTKVNSICFMGAEVSEIVNDHIKQSNKDISCYKAMKKGYALERLFKIMPNISLVYDWNENQNIDRSLTSVSLNLGISVKGVKQYFADLNNIELYNTSAELKNNCLPLKVLDVTDKHSCFYQRVKQEILVSYTPYYRQFQKLRYNPSQTALLVVLPNGFAASIAILELLDGSDLMGLTVYVRHHPSLSKELFKKHCNGFEWVDSIDEFYELSNSVSHILTTASSFLVEAMNAGLNVAIFDANIEICYRPLDIKKSDIIQITSVRDLEDWVSKINMHPTKLNLFMEK